MLSIRTILHPTDFSARSNYALWLACALAEDHRAHLHVLHVVSVPTVVYGEGVAPPAPAEFRAEAQRHLDRLQSPRPRLALEKTLVEGDVVDMILRHANETLTDLIVMGTHGRTGLARLLMGSVAEQVVRKSTCPVLTVKTPFPELRSRRSQQRDETALKVKDVMTRGVECTEPDASLRDAAVKMKTLDVGPLPVCDKGRVVGMVTDRDITVRATAASLPPQLGRVRDVMTPNVIYCFEDADVAEAARLMEENHVRRLVVLDHDKHLSGIVSLADVAVKTRDEELCAEALEQLSEPAAPRR